MTTKNYQTESYQAIVTRHGQADYPPGHQVGMRVPRGGSSCEKCRYLGRDRKTCDNEFFIRWNGSNKIPGSIDSYCSDHFEPAKTVCVKSLGKRFAQPSLYEVVLAPKWRMPDECRAKLSAVLFVFNDIQVDIIGY